MSYPFIAQAVGSENDHSISNETNYYKIVTYYTNSEWQKEIYIYKQGILSQKLYS